MAACVDRLQQLQEAEMAYRNCVRDVFHAEVWEKLMWLYTEEPNEPPTAPSLPSERPEPTRPNRPDT